MKFIYLRLLVAIYIPPILALLALIESGFNLLNLLIFSCIIVIYGIAWDMWATRHGKTDKLWIWRFNPKTVTGISIAHHPFDEYIFGICHIVWLILLWEILNHALQEKDVTTLHILIVTIVWQIVVGWAFYNSQKSRRG